jgi:hypothetical protein
MSVLSMRSSSADVNPTITLNELQDRCNFHQCSMLMPGRGLIRRFEGRAVVASVGSAGQVAHVGSSVMLSRSPGVWHGSLSVV